MRELLEYILKGITGNKKINVSENEENGHINLSVDLPNDLMGIVIGKGGKTIKMIRNILRVRATLEKKTVSIILPEGNLPEAKS